MCAKRPSHILQDILNSYHQNSIRRQTTTTHPSPPLLDVGVILEYPIRLTFEGAKTPEKAEGNPTPKRYLALSINGSHPNRVLHVNRPYERYMEYDHIPATMWNPLSFTPSYFPIHQPDMQKVMLDGSVIGIRYRRTFFCFEHPFLEGRPSRTPLLNTDCLLTVATFPIREDPNLRIADTFRESDDLSLCQVNLVGIPTKTWCLIPSDEMHPYPKRFVLPPLVKEWVRFFTELKGKTFEADDTRWVRLILMLSKHNICYKLNLETKASTTIRLSDKEVNFYLKEEVIQFINDVRLVKTSSPSADESSCSVS